MRALPGSQNPIQGRMNSKAGNDRNACSLHEELAIRRAIRGHQLTPAANRRQGVAAAKGRGPRRYSSGITSGFDAVGCHGFPGHLVKVQYGTGGGLWPTRRQFSKEFKLEAAKPPGPLASEPTRRLYEANLWVARDYFTHHGVAVASPASSESVDWREM